MDTEARPALALYAPVPVGLLAGSPPPSKPPIIGAIATGRRNGVPEPTLASADVPILRVEAQTLGMRNVSSPDPPDPHQARLVVLPTERPPGNGASPRRNVAHG